MFILLVAEPLSIFVDTYGTGKKSDDELVSIIKANWDLRPGVIGMLPEIGLRSFTNYFTQSVNST